MKKSMNEEPTFWEKILFAIMIGFSLFGVGCFMFIAVPAVFNFLVEPNIDEVEDLGFEAVPAYFTYERDTNNERWEMIKDYLGVVEWNKLNTFKIRPGKNNTGYTLNNTGDTLICSTFGKDDEGLYYECQKKEDFEKVKTYLTSDENKVEWVELGCENWVGSHKIFTLADCEKINVKENINDCVIAKSEIINRCKELKDLIN